MNRNETEPRAGLWDVLVVSVAWAWTVATLWTLAAITG